MNALEGVEQDLARAISSTESGRGHLAVAVELQEEAAAALAEVTQGSQDLDIQHAVEQHDLARDELRLVVEALGKIVEAIGSYRRSIGAREAPTSTSSAAPPSTPRQSPSAVTNSHGDQYPAEAAELIEDLPPRVVPGAQQRTKGRAKIAGKTIPITSGKDPYWEDVIRNRLAEINVRSDQLQYHAEVKLAAMAVTWGQRHTEVAINYTPCGYERQKRFQDVCHKVLPKFLPPGHSMTVYGTTRHNQPFQWTYQGQEQT